MSIGFDKCLADRFYQLLGRKLGQEGVNMRGHSLVCLAERVHKFGDHFGLSANTVDQQPDGSRTTLQDHWLVSVQLEQGYAIG
ncbi:hypothetical protein JOE31_001303 [Arthrobacter sp. PvP023]|nr:hypothetical protein [Arthrobacter sp. PvP023]